MTPKQTATLVSRAFCIWFAYVAFTRLAVIPSLIFNLRMMPEIGSRPENIRRYSAYPMLMGGGVVSLFGLVIDIAPGNPVLSLWPGSDRILLGQG